MLSADVISELSSTEQTQEDEREVSSHETHGSVPQPSEDHAAVESFFDRSQADELVKVGAVFFKDLSTDGVGHVALSVSVSQEGLAIVVVIESII